MLIKLTVTANIFSSSKADCILSLEKNNTQQKSLTSHKYIKSPFKLYICTNPHSKK